MRCLLDWSGAKAKDAYRLHNACHHYVTHYNDRHCYIKVLGMNQPVALRDIYTAVNCVNPKYLRKFATDKELESTMRKAGLRGFSPHEAAFKGFAPHDSQPQDALGTANKTQFLSVLGQPGAGKSTFLRRIGLEALLPSPQRSYTHECLPVFVELKAFKSNRIDLDAIIQEELLNISRLDTSSTTDASTNSSNTLATVGGARSSCWPQALQEPTTSSSAWLRNLSLGFRTNPGYAPSPAGSWRTSHPARTPR
jgi:hypothetical protein